MISADWYDEHELSIDEIVEICRQVRKERAEQRKTMILSPKFKVDDRVKFTNTSFHDEQATVIGTEVFFRIQYDNGVQNVVSEDRLVLVSRPCQHTRGYYPYGYQDGDSKNWVTHAYCPKCGEKL